MQDKIVVITGGTSGVGQATAIGLARRGATVAIVCRDADKGAATQAEIARQTGSQQTRIFLADLTAQDSVRQVARDIQTRFPRIDVLVNNAGGVFGSRQVTVDGVERTFALNHLAYFLLTNLLLDTLKASGPARIVSVSSEAHRMTSMHFGDPQFTQGYTIWTAYGQSKLANILFTRELARQLQGSQVTANCLHPGFVASHFGQGGGSLWSMGMRLMRPFQITPEKGAETSIYLASSSEVATVSGAYFIKAKRATPSAAARDDAAARKLWEISAALTGVAVA
jgi:NAD(P)-dependent dehydrogenase (short-subunit alcohol dehydrogenase family)